MKLGKDISPFFLLLIAVDIQRVGEKKGDEWEGWKS